MVLVVVVGRVVVVVVVVGYATISIVVFLSLFYFQFDSILDLVFFLRS